MVKFPFIGESTQGQVDYTQVLSASHSSVVGFGLLRFCSKSVSVKVCSRGVQYITCIGRCRCIGMEAMLITCM